MGQCQAQHGGPLTDPGLRKKQGTHLAAAFSSSAILAVVSHAMYVSVHALSALSRSSVHAAAPPSRRSSTPETTFAIHFRSLNKVERSSVLGAHQYRRAGIGTSGSRIKYEMKDDCWKIQEIDARKSRKAPQPLLARPKTARADRGRCMRQRSSVRGVRKTGPQHHRCTVPGQRPTDTARGARPTEPETKREDGCTHRIPVCVPFWPVGPRCICA